VQVCDRSSEREIESNAYRMLVVVVLGLARGDGRCRIVVVVLVAVRGVLGLDDDAVECNITDFSGM